MADATGLACWLAGRTLPLLHCPTCKELPMARRVMRAERRVGALLLPCALTSAFGAVAPIPAQVAFAPPAEAKFQTYGKSEELILQGRILDAVTNACESTARD